MQKAFNLEISSFVKSNYKKIAALIVLFATICIFGYCLYLTYSVLISNGSFESSLLTVDGGGYHIDREMISKIENSMTDNKTLQTKINQLTNPF